MTDRILAYLEGRPIKVGDTLYDLSGASLTAAVSNDVNYQLRMRVRDSVSWLTNTHFQDKQVLFWTRLPDDHQEVVAWKLQALQVRLARVEASIEASLNLLTQELTAYEALTPDQGHKAIVAESLAACTRTSQALSDLSSRVKSKVFGPKI